MLESRINEWLRRFESGDFKVTVIRTPYDDIGGVSFMSVDGKRRWWAGKPRSWLTGYLGLPVEEELGKYTIYVYIYPGTIDDPRPVASLQGIDTAFFDYDDDGDCEEEMPSLYNWHDLGPVEVIEAK